MSTEPLSDRGKLGNFLKEVINWQWDEFCRAEQDNAFTGYQSTVFALVRTCSEGKLGAIKLAIDRVDGKIETPIKIEYPKVYFLYPEATRLAKPSFRAIGTDPDKTNTLTLPAPPEAEPEPTPEPEEEPVTAATLSLRETLHRMADSPRKLVPVILNRKKEVEAGTLKENPDDPANIPLVKSVIAANLLHLAEKNNFEAITEVFDQIDGKLVETIRILGDDIFLTQYTLEAPYGAKKNKDGVYYIEAKEVAESWRQKLKDN